MCGSKCVTDNKWIIKPKNGITWCKLYTGLWISILH